MHIKIIYSLSVLFAEKKLNNNNRRILKTCALVYGEFFILCNYNLDVEKLTNYTKEIKYLPKNKKN